MLLKMKKNIRRIYRKRWKKCTVVALVAPKNSYIEPKWWKKYFTWIRDNPNELIKSLEEMKKTYLKLDLEDREKYYYTIRQEFNKENTNKVITSAYLIFLNKLCFKRIY